MKAKRAIVKPVSLMIKIPVRQGHFVTRKNLDEVITMLGAIGWDRKSAHNVSLPLH